MTTVFKIDGPLADKYHGCGYALAAVLNGQLVDIKYLDDIFIFDCGSIDAKEVPTLLNDQRLGPTVRYLQSLGEVFVGMCSCYEFVVL